MSKKLLAVDIDDVLGDTTEALRLFVNEREGLSLTSEDYNVSAAYWGYYEQVWVNAGITDKSHLDEFHKQMGINQDNIQVIEGAQESIEYLKQQFDLLAITSRDLFMEDETKRWLTKHFNGDFKNVVLLGQAGAATQTKGQICAELGVTKLIDDNIDHCLSAVQSGSGAVLFGEYGWNSSEVPHGIQRALNWNSVPEILSA